MRILKNYIMLQGNPSDTKPADTKFQEILNKSVKKFEAKNT